MTEAFFAKDKIKVFRVILLNKYEFFDLLCSSESPAQVPQWDKHPCDMYEPEQKRGIPPMLNTRSRIASSGKNNKMNNIV